MPSIQAILQGVRTRTKIVANGSDGVPAMQFNFNDDERQDDGNAVDMPSLNEDEEATACGDMLQHLLDVERGDGVDRGAPGYKVDQSDETSKINVNKPYKRRRLKLDPIHRLSRQVYKLKKRNPAYQRKKKVYLKKYKARNKMALKRRSQVVRVMKKRLPPVQPRPKTHSKFYVAQAGTTFPNTNYEGMRAGPPAINTAPDDSHTITDFNSSAPYYAYSHKNMMAMVRALVTQVRAVFNAS